MLHTIRNNPREPEAAVDRIFVDRWSPRSFSHDPVDVEDLKALFEAARWAPSCYGEQPWLFVYADTWQDRQRFRPLLTDANRVWAYHAPVLAFLFTRRSFTRNGKENRWAGFDAGAAWMALTFQARLKGLFTHAMAGFLEDKVYEVLGVPEEDYRAMAAIAIGYKDQPEILPEELQKMEQPNGRKPLAEIAFEGVFKAGDTK